MSDEKKEIIELALDDGGFGFRVRWRYESHWADVEVWEVTGLIEGNPQRPTYLRKGATSGMDSVLSIDEAEHYLSGYIKWDACSHLEIGETHYCGVHSFQNHAKLMEYLYRRSRVLMGQEDEWRDADQSTTSHQEEK